MVNSCKAEIWKLIEEELKDLTHCGQNITSNGLLVLFAFWNVEM